MHACKEDKFFFTTSFALKINNISGRQFFTHRIVSSLCPYYFSKEHQRPIIRKSLLNERTLSVCSKFIYSSFGLSGGRSLQKIVKNEALERRKKGIDRQMDFAEDS
jgi:hypothetical protein